MVGVTPRTQGEVDAGRRLRGDRPSVGEHDNPTIEQLADLDAGARPGAAGGAGRELDAARAQADGVVAGHDATVAAAQDEGQRRRGPPPHGVGIHRRAREAPIEVLHKVGQERVGRLPTVDPMHPELTNEAILQRAPEPLDATLALR